MPLRDLLLLFRLSAWDGGVVSAQPAGSVGMASGWDALQR
jgi:hypothetical protein